MPESRRSLRVCAWTPLNPRRPHEDRRRGTVHCRFVRNVVLDVVVINGPLVLEGGEPVWFGDRDTALGQEDALLACSRPIHVSLPARCA